MKFQTEDEGDIAWMRNPDGYEAGPTIRRIKNAGKWNEFLALHQNEDGVVDCDGLYDYLRHDSGNALLDVGLHENEGVATVEDVLKAWDDKNYPENGSKVSRKDGKPTGLMLFRYGSGNISLDFESVDQNGEIESVSLDEDEVLELVGHMANNNATAGAWDCTDENAAEFEMWRGK